GTSPQPFAHLVCLAHARVALGTADPGAVAEQVELLHPPAIDDVERAAPAADAVEARRHFRHDLRGHHAGVYRDHQLDALRHHGERRGEHPGRKVGTEEALGDEPRVEAKPVGAADDVARKREGPVRAPREARTRFDFRNGAIHAGLGSDRVRQRGPNSEIHRGSRHNLKDCGNEPGKRDSSPSPSLLAYARSQLWRSRALVEIVMSRPPRQPALQCPRRSGALAVVFIAVLWAGAAQAQTRITTGMVAHGPPQWPQYIATELGWFKQDNIELDFTTAGGGGAQQLAAGALDICHSGYPDFARASLQGAPVKIIINDIAASPYAVFAKPSIKRVADLKGKLINIGGNNDITFIYIKPFLASAGLQTSDVDLIYAKAAGDRFSALVAGGVDATILNHPTYAKAVALGFSNLGDTKPYAEDIPFTVWAANMPWAAKHRDALVAFARNYQRGVRWLYDPANKQQAIDIL